MFRPRNNMFQLSMTMWMILGFLSIYPSVAKACTVSIVGDLSGKNVFTYFDEEKLNITWLCNPTSDNDTLSITNHDTTKTKVLWEQKADNITQTEGTVLHQFGKSPGNYSIQVEDHSGPRTITWINVIKRPKLVMPSNPCGQGAPCIAEGQHKSGLKNMITYSIALYAQPTANVTVTISLPMNAQGGYEMTLFPQVLLFTPENFGAPQEVQITSVDDNFHEPDEVWTFVHTAQSADTRYEGLDLEFDVLAVDDERTGVLVTFDKLPNQNLSDIYLSALDDPDEVTYIVLHEGVDDASSFSQSCQAQVIQVSIELLSQPRSVVTLQLQSRNHPEKPLVSDLIFGTNDAASTLHFVPNEWNVTKVFLLGVANDGEYFGDWNAQFAVSSTSSDHDYNVEWVGNPKASNAGVLMYGISGAVEVEDVGPSVASKGWVPIVVREDDRVGVEIQQSTTTLGALPIESDFEPDTWRFLGEGAHRIEYNISGYSVPSGSTFIVLVNNCSVKISTVDFDPSLIKSNDSTSTALAIVSAATIEISKPLLSINGQLGELHAIRLNESNWGKDISIDVRAFDDETKLYERNTLWCALRHFVVSADTNYNDDLSFNVSTLESALETNDLESKEMYEMIDTLSFETPNGYFDKYSERFNVLVDSNDTATIARLDATRGSTLYNDMCGRYPLTQRTDAVLKLVVMDDDSSFMSKGGARVAGSTVGTLCIFLVVGTIAIGGHSIWVNADKIVTEAEAKAKEEAERKAKEKQELSKATSMRNLETPKIKRSLTVARLDKVVTDVDRLKKLVEGNDEPEEVPAPLSHLTFLYLMVSELQFLVFLSQTNAVAQHSVILRVFAQGFWWANFQVAITGTHYVETNLYKSSTEQAIRFDILFTNTFLCYSAVLLFAVLGRRICRGVFKAYLNSTKAKIAVEPIVLNEVDLENMKREQNKLQELSKRVSMRSHQKLLKTESKAKIALGERYKIDQDQPNVIHESDENNLTANEAEELSPAERQRRASVHSNDVDQLRVDRLTAPWLWELPVLLMGFTGMMQASAMAVWRHMLTGVGILGMVVGVVYGLGLVCYTAYRLTRDVVKGKVIVYKLKQINLRADLKVETDDTNKEEDGKQDFDGTKKRRSSASVSDVAQFIPGLAHHSKHNSDVFGWWEENNPKKDFLLRFGLLISSINGAKRLAIYHVPIQLTRQIISAVIFALFSSMDTAFMKKSQVMWLATVEGSFLVLFLLRPSFRSPTVNFYFLLSALSHFGCCFGSAWLVDGTVLEFQFQRDFIEKCIVSVSMFIVLAAALLQVNDVLRAPISAFYEEKLTKWFKCLPSTEKKLLKVKEIDVKTKGKDEIEMENLIAEAQKLGYDVENPVEKMLADSVQQEALRHYKSEASMLSKQSRPSNPSSRSSGSISQLVATSPKAKGAVVLEPIARTRLSGHGKMLTAGVVNPDGQQNRKRKTFLQ